MNAKKEYEKPMASITNDRDPVSSLKRVFAYDMESRKTLNESTQIDFNIDEFKQMMQMINEYFICAPELIITRYTGNYREYQLINAIVDFYKSVMAFINSKESNDMFLYRGTIETTYNTFLSYGNQYYGHWALLWEPHRDAIISIMLVMSYLNDTDSKETFNKLTQIATLNICACILMYNSLAWVEEDD